MPIDRFSFDRALARPFIGKHSIDGHCRRNDVAHPSGVYERIKVDERYTIRLLFDEWLGLGCERRRFRHSAGLPIVH